MGLYIFKIKPQDVPQFTQLSIFDENFMDFCLIVFQNT